MQAYYEVLSLKKCYGAAVNKCGTHVYTREPNDEANDAKVLNSKNAPRAVMLYGLLIMSVYLCGMWLHAHIHVESGVGQPKQRGRTFMANIKAALIFLLLSF